MASTSLPSVLTRRSRRACAELQRRQRRRWRLVADGLGRVAVEQDQPRHFNRRDHAIGARRAVRWVRDRSHRLHAQASRCVAEHRSIKKGRQWLRATRLPIRVGDREWPPGAPTRSITIASTAVPEANRGGGCSCPTRPRRLRRWDCSHRNERALPLRSRKRTGGYCSSSQEFRRSGVSIHRTAPRFGGLNPAKAGIHEWLRPEIRSLEGPCVCFMV